MKIIYSLNQKQLERFLLIINSETENGLVDMNNLPSINPITGELKFCSGPVFHVPTTRVPNPDKLEIQYVTYGDMLYELTPMSTFENAIIQVGYPPLTGITYIVKGELHNYPDGDDYLEEDVDNLMEQMADASYYGDNN